MNTKRTSANNGLKKISLATLDEMLDEHSNWLASGRRAGMCANLSRTDLRGVNLENTNLKWANLAFANLEKANLVNTDLTRPISAGPSSWLLICMKPSCRRQNYFLQT
ncbi:MAG: pentapeptide repeat-containing protein [Desulfobacterales bacterium]|nr:pentapeptide repeat-containing protein [Desulfobacterales bacterium]